MTQLCLSCDSAGGVTVILLCCSALQSLVLGESVSMYTPADDQRNFYEDLMVTARHSGRSHDPTPTLMSYPHLYRQNQLTSRLQESDSRQEVEEEGEELRRRSFSVVPDLSGSSQPSSKKKQRHREDPVISATLQQLQQLGVDVDDKALTTSERKIQEAVESYR